MGGSGSGCRLQTECDILVKWRLAISFITFTLAVLLVQDIPLAQYFRGVEEARIVTQLERDGFVLASTSQEALESPSIASMETLQDAIDRYQISNNARILVTDKVGLVLADSASPGLVGESIYRHKGIQASIDGVIATGKEFTADNTKRLYVAVPIIHGDSLYGVVLSTYPLDAINSRVLRRISIIAAAGGLALVLAAFIAILFARGITRRLDRLRATTVDFAMGDLTARADQDKGDSEIRSLAESFNTMADRIARLFEQQRAFAADASHQLRTPLTALQLRLEDARSLIDEDPKLASLRLDAAVAESERLQALIEGLLVLSRADAKNYPDSQVFDLSEVARERCEGWAALAAESDIGMSITCPQQALVRAVPNALEQVIDNYVDNALAMAPPHSSISIVVVPGAKFTSLHVKDDGPGLDNQDLERAFNRFWRGRSDSTGSGLGLAIVERLVVASGGQVRLTNRIPHGLDAQADFPTA